MTTPRITWSERHGFPVGRLGEFTAQWYGYRGVEILAGDGRRALGWISADGLELDPIAAHIRRRQDVEPIMRAKLHAFAAARGAAGSQ